MNILFIHCSGPFGGAAKSLIELYKQLKLNNGVRGFVLSPNGTSGIKFKEAGLIFYGSIGLMRFDNTQFGYYRGLRWLIFIREIFFLIPSLIALFRVWRKSDYFDVIHANEITVLPVALLAKAFFKCPLVVHVRSVQQNEKSHFRARVISFFLNKYASAVIAIDDTVLASMPQIHSPSVIHNGLFFKNPEEFFSHASDNDIIRVGIVGNLLRLKGLYEFMEAARVLIVDRHLKIHFVVVGENVRNHRGLMSGLYKKIGFSEDVMADLLLFVKSNKLAPFFEIKGFVGDIEAIYSNMDILCFPSHLNAIGRPVFEAAFFGVPCIAAVTNPKPDTIIDGVTGICIDRPEPIALANAIEYLIKNPEIRQLLGKNAYALALENFDIKKNGVKLYDLYKKIL